MPWSSTGVTSTSIADNVLYIGAGKGDVYALNATSGEKIWSYNVSDSYLDSVVEADGMVCVLSANGTVSALRVSSQATSSQTQQSPLPPLSNLNIHLTVAAVFVAVIAVAVVLLILKKKTKSRS